MRHRSFLVLAALLACGPSAPAPTPAPVHAIAIEPAPSAAPAVASAPTAAPEASPESADAGTSDEYAWRLSRFFAARLQVPPSITAAEAKKLCVVVQVNVTHKMEIWHTRSEPVVSSGNDAFDAAAIAMMRKITDDAVVLPQPPKDVDDLYRGRVMRIVLRGDLHGDASRCLR